MQNQIKGFAEFFDVPKENIRIIKRKEYEENTEED
nr:MAG TPA: alpha-dystroglycan domain-containing protein [Bacteriophage sp.]